MKEMKKVLVFVAAGALALSLMGCSSSSPKEDSTTTQPDAATEQKAETPAPAPEVPAEYKSALNKAGIYSGMAMSKQGIYDQLIAEYGDKFTAEAAQYAVDNLVADYNANALEKAKVYQDQMSMSPAAIADQLVSENGDKFTQEEADYAVANL